MSDDWSTPGGGDAPPPPPPPPPPTGVPPPPPPGARPAQGRVGVVPMHPMGVGQILDTSFRMLRATALPAVIIVVLLLGPIQLLASAGVQSPFAFSQPVPEAPDPRFLVLAGIGWLLTVFVVPLVQVAMTWLGAHATEQDAPDWQVALRAGARHYWRTLGAWVLVGLVVLVGFGVGFALVALLGVAVHPVAAVLVGIPLALAALVASIGASVIGYLVVPCIVIEQRRPVDGLRRAWQLLLTRFWPTVGISLLVGLVLTLLGGAVSTAISLPGFLPFPGAWIFIAIGAVLDQLVRAPLSAYAALTIHVDLRIRSEGYDLAVLASELRR